MVLVLFIYIHEVKGVRLFIQNDTFEENIKEDLTAPCLTQ